MACIHAIDDRTSMIDGHRNPHYPEHAAKEFLIGSEDYVEKCKAEIRDFKKLIKSCS
jgi:hypothetical protein